MDVLALKVHALSFNEISETPHFEKKSFMVATKIFTTLDTNNLKVILQTYSVDQALFSDLDSFAIYRATDASGKQR